LPLGRHGGFAAAAAAVGWRVGVGGASAERCPLDADAVQLGVRLPPASARKHKRQAIAMRQIKNRCACCLFAIGEYKLDRLGK
jgi:hypothetical protein